MKHTRAYHRPLLLVVLAALALALWLMTRGLVPGLQMGDFGPPLHDGLFDGVIDGQAFTGSFSTAWLTELPSLLLAGGVVSATLLVVATLVVVLVVVVLALPMALLAGLALLMALLLLPVLGIVLAAVGGPLLAGLLVLGLLLLPLLLLARLLRWLLR